MADTDAPLAPAVDESKGHPLFPEDRGGKSVQDFGSDGLLAAIRRSLGLLSHQNRIRLYLIAGIQVSLALLDLLGITLLGMLAAVAVSGVGATGIPPIVQRFVDFLGLENLTVSQLSVVLATVAVVVLVSKTAISAYVSRRIFRFLANRQADVSARLARKFLSRPLLEVQRWTTSEAIYALGGGVGAATVAVLGSAIIIASEVFLFFVVAITLLLVDPLTTLGAMVLFGLVVLVMHRYLSRRGARNSQIITDSSIDTLSAVSEALQTYRETTVLSRRELYIAKYQGLIGNYARATASNAYIMEVPKYVLEATLYLSVLALAVTQFLTKDLGAAAASVALFLAAGSRVVPALLRLQGASITIRNASVQAQPTYYLANELKNDTSDQSVIDRAKNPLTAAVIKSRIAAGHGNFDPTIRVDNVSVTYFGAAVPALASTSFTLAAGRSCALVGSTGAGKSTLADVIIGVIEPDQGSVTVGGLTPGEAIAKFPGAISYVPQAVALVFGSVRENVALGLPLDAIDDALVWEALERAHLAEFLRESREGLDTMIGERGVRLSGGQRQRLGIARALYTRPRLLVLDEATSALDAETEQAIINTLDELEGDVTTVTVAHRLATVRRADQLLYLKNGEVVARGTFEEVRTQVSDFDRQASLLGL
jgi:ABC-type multidrug transport system fused ATPase/permease subunit